MPLTSWFYVGKMAHVQSATCEHGGTSTALSTRQERTRELCFCGFLGGTCCWESSAGQRVLSLTHALQLHSRRDRHFLFTPVRVNRSPLSLLTALDNGVSTYTPPSQLRHEYQHCPCTRVSVVSCAPRHQAKLARHRRPRCSTQRTPAHVRHANSFTTPSS
jgi:hypothetical protein